MTFRIATASGLAALFVLAALGAAGLCCQQVLSIDGKVTVQETASACGLPVPVGACEACVAQSCCAQASGCADDPGCMSLESCLLACGGDYACRATCVSNNLNVAQVPVATLDTCVATNCESACGVTCGVAGSYTTPDKADDCQACIAGAGCGAEQACAADLSCEIGAHCAYACITPDCRNACGAGVDAAIAAEFLDAALAVGAGCTARCAWGQNWTCVGKVGAPRAKNTTAPQDVAITVNGSDGGVPGVSVAACQPNVVPCTAPQASATTNAQGVALLTGLPVPGLFGYTGYFQLTAPGYLDTTYWLSFPLSEEHAQLTLSLTDPATLAGFLAEVGAQPIPGRGHIVMQVDDCLQLPASGVVVNLEGPMDPQTVRAYLSLATFDRGAPSTNISGLVAFFNVPPGQVTLDVVPPTTNGEAVAKATVIVQDGGVAQATGLPISE